VLYEAGTGAFRNTGIFLTTDGNCTNQPVFSELKQVAAICLRRSRLLKRTK
jgi:hypothetical protein